MKIDFNLKPRKMKSKKCKHNRKPKIFSIWDTVKSNPIEDLKYLLSEKE